MFGFFGGQQSSVKKPKDYVSQMSHMESYRGKSVIMTGGTGGIGSKVLKRLLKAGKMQIFKFYRCQSSGVCQRSIYFRFKDETL